MQSKSHSVVEVGALADWSSFRFPFRDHPPLHKFFLKEPMGLSGMEVSLNHLVPGDGMPFTHRHGRNEELYIFLSGNGEFQVESEVLPIRPGTCVRCAPETNRAWRCTGTEPLHFLCIQAPAGGYGEGKETADGLPGELPVAW